MGNLGHESEFFLLATPTEVFSVCREIGRNLDLVVIDKPRNRLVLRGQFPNQDLRIDVQVVQENEGSHVFLDLERTPVPHLKWAESIGEGYGGHVLDRVRKELETSFAREREPPPLIGGGGSQRPSLRSHPLLVTPLRWVAVYCMLLGAGLFAVAVFTWPRPGAAYGAAAVCLGAVSSCLQTLKRRILDLASWERYLLAAGWVVIACVAVTLYSLWQ
jgi:hypothetical protein